MRNFVSVILIIGLLAGCGFSTTQEEASEQEKNETEEVTEVEKTKPQGTEQTEVGEQPEVTKTPENNSVEQTLPQIEQKTPAALGERQSDEQKPDVVQEEPEKGEQKTEVVEEQIPEQPVSPIEQPEPEVPQEPVVPQKTPQQLFNEYVDSGNWTLTTNTNYFGRRQIYVYGVQEVEENFVGNYVKRYIEQNISGGNPVIVTVYHIGNGVKTYKFTW